MTITVPKRGLILLGLIGIVGHVVGMAADLYSGFVPALNIELGPITSLSLDSIAPLFEAKSLAQARIGHYLAILFIPLGAAGVWQVFLILNPSNNSAAFVFLGLGALGVIYGAFYHGTLAFVIAALQAGSVQLSTPGGGPTLLIDYVNSLSEPLSLLLLGTDFSVSLIYGLMVASGRSLFPRWMAAYNPLVIQLILNGIILLAPASFVQVLWLTVFNSSLAIWYTGTTIIIASSERLELALQ